MDSSGLTLALFESFLLLLFPRKVNPIRKTIKKILEADAALQERTTVLDNE
jgi:hypothetical protein